VRTLGDAAAAGKWRYVLNVVTHRLAIDDPCEEDVKYFSAAIGALRGWKAKPKLAEQMQILRSYAVGVMRRDLALRRRCAMDWLCLFPDSTVALRALADLSRKSTGFEQLFLAAMQLLPIEKISRDGRIQLCRTLLANGRGDEAAAIARKILELQPESAEARHLLWSALLQSGENGKKLFTAGCE
jgi:hypothetical protein